MYEFEFWNQESGEYEVMYGYSMNDLHRRYQDVDFSKLKLVLKHYID